LPALTTLRQAVRQKLQINKLKTSYKKMVNEMGKGWKDKLPDALRAYRTTYKTPIGMSPYQLVYEKVSTYRSS